METAGLRYSERKVRLLIDIELGCDNQDPKLGFDAGEGKL